MTNFRIENLKNKIIAEINALAVNEELGKNPHDFPARRAAQINRSNIERMLKELVA